jgi:hypothetical protein
MQKEFEKQEKLKNLDEEHKKQMVNNIEKQEKKHKEHEPVSVLSVFSGLRSLASCERGSQFVILQSPNAINGFMSRKWASGLYPSSGFSINWTNRWNSD